MEIWKYGNMDIWEYGNMENLESSSCLLLSIGCNHLEAKFVKAVFQKFTSSHFCGLSSKKSSIMIVRMKSSTFALASLAASASAAIAL